MVKKFKHGGFYDQFITFSPSGKYLVSWLPEKLTVFDVSTEKAVGSLDKGHFPLAFSSDEKTFYTVKTGALESWSCPGLKAQTSVKTLPGKASTDGSWKLLEWSTGSKSLIGNIGRLATWPPSAREFPVSPYNVACTPDGKMVAYSVGNSIAVDDPSTKEEAWESPILGRSVTSVVISDDGKLAVGGCMNGAVSVVDLEKRKVISPQGVPGEVRCMALGSDGSTLAIGCGDGMTEVAVVDIQTSEVLGTVKPGYGNTWAVAISPDNKILATGSDDGVIRLWQLN